MAKSHWRRSSSPWPQHWRSRVALAHATAAAGDGTGFAADSTIGVALPDKTSENWVLAGDLFTNGLRTPGTRRRAVRAGEQHGRRAAEPDHLDDHQRRQGHHHRRQGRPQLSAQVEAAKKAGAVVIAYDRLILNTDAVDYYLAFDNYKVGELQGQALLDGLRASPGQEDSGTSSCSPGRPTTTTPASSSTGR